MAAIFFADEMTSTPFDNRKRTQHLSSLGMEEADSAESADVVVSRRLADLTPYLRTSKPCHIWTHEPFWMPVAEKFLIDGPSDKKIGVSTAFNGDVYCSPLFYFPSKKINFDDLIRVVRSKAEKCVFLATFRAKSDRYIENVNVDLSTFRQDLATYLARTDDCHIYGRSWPESIPTKGESRGSGWHNAKLGIIEAYQFNIACENTIARNYITEKFWDATLAGCIPIYFAHGTGIEELANPNSFIDCSKMAPEQVAEKINSLRQDEIDGMLEAGVRRFNEISDSSTKKEVEAQYLTRFKERILEAVG